MATHKMDGGLANPQKELLRQKTPQIFTEGKVDFDKLKQTALRDALLPKLMKGEIRVKEPAIFAGSNK